MPKKGRVTIAGTSLPEIVAKLIDRFIKESQEKYPFLEWSRPKVLELALFSMLSQRNFLEPFLKELGWTDAQIGSIKQYLQAAS